VIIVKHTQVGSRIQDRTGVLSRAGRTGKQPGGGSVSFLLFDVGGNDLQHIELPAVAAILEVSF